jgi:hypothetical protein
MHSDDARQCATHVNVHGECNLCGHCTDASWLFRAALLVLAEQMCCSRLFTQLTFALFPSIRARSYETTIVEGNKVKPVETKMQFKTEKKVGKVGVMLIGLGGNNGW